MMRTNALVEPPCDDAHERPRFFPRQLITPDDLNLVLGYFRDKLRRHNRLIHGWGVVCGAKVCPIMNSEGSIEPWKVRVTPGYLLGPYGDEILIDCERTVDLRTRGVNGVTGEPCVEAPDPWCSEVFIPCEETGPRYIAVKYKEMMSRPVRVQPVGCGCDDTQCEYSRWKDGYEIGILTRCPESHEGEPPDTKRLLFSGPIPECPSCPSEPWVVLAKVEIGEDGTIQTIDNCSCRRLVLSFGHLWWRCEGGEVKIDSVKLDGRDLKALIQGETYEGITIKGKNFQQGAKVSLGEGVTVEDVSVNKNKKELTFSATVIDAEPGKRSLTVINPDCSVGVGEIEIEAAGERR